MQVLAKIQKDLIAGMLLDAPNAKAKKLVSEVIVMVGPASPSAL